MTRFDELRELLAPSERPFIGVVTSLTDGTVAVRSGAGRVVVARPANLALAVGDEVLVQAGIVQGRVKRAADVPVYHV